MSIKVLDMTPYKDPDEFMKNLGPDAFRQRIGEAKNSFLFEIGVLHGQYQMEDPEQKTLFYQETARKLLEFQESLERDNYIQAVSREFFIPYEDLKRLVNQMGSHLGAGVGRTVSDQDREYKERKDKRKTGKRGMEEGVRQSQRLLLTWLIENPELFSKIEGIISADDFIEPLYHQVAETVFQGQKQGGVNPAAVLNDFINDEEQYREVAALFHASLKESLSNEEQKKAFQETVVKVKKSSLDQASRQAKDIEELQRIIKEQAALGSLHISLD